MAPRARGCGWPKSGPSVVVEHDAWWMPCASRTSCLRDPGEASRTQVVVRVDATDRDPRSGGATR
ncbi:hypothetical protein C4D60_Mb00t00570 [Musa balbisiana]|uniref:Uncharacterized protein n=1 Tax=Musa balbisiana TaxID=52838 RepID=A0A4S8I4T5_MUSBA|nr:hypothetical protein C4D60_Mb00t00550 [Musa balbisiana]THU42865.1 hypothetical protein C4D60_Mb00t00570 [Musa balbisiana]